MASNGPYKSLIPSTLPVSTPLGAEAGATHARQR